MGRQDPGDDPDRSRVDPEAGSPVDPARSGRERVLLVDDSATVRAVYGSAFRAAGFVVDEAEDGLAALHMLEATPYGVMVTDIQMDLAGGFEVLEALRFHADPPEVILLTASFAGDVGSAVRALRLGAHDFLPKPSSTPEQAVLSVARALEKRRDRDALRVAEERHRQLFERVPVGLYRTLPDGTFLEANAALVSLLGFPDRRTLLSTNAAVLYAAPGDRARWRTALDSGEGTAAVHAEWLLHRFDGSVVMVEESVRVARAPTGEVECYEGSVIDITERKQVETAIRESEAQYRLFFQSNPNPMWVYDAETLSFLAVNEAAVRAYGWSETEFLGMTIRDIRPPEDVAPVVARVAAHLEGGVEVDQSGPWRHHTREGCGILVEIASHAVRFQGRPARLVVAHDVTEKRRAEEALLRSERQLSRAQHLAHVGSWEWDLEAGRLTWSDELRRIHGLPPGGEGLALEQAMTHIHPDDRALVATALEGLRADRRPVEYRSRVVRPDGTVRILETHCELAGARVLGSAQDLTEALEIEEELRRKTGQLEAIVEAMTAFLETQSLPAAGVRLVRAALRQTDSGYGFIGVSENAALRLVAIEGIVWSPPDARSEPLQAALSDLERSGSFVFHGLDNLFGQVMRTGRGVLANDPQHDPRAKGLPVGHAPLKSFLGVPVLRGSEVLGMIGVANRPGGYTGQEEDRLRILTSAAGLIFEAWRRERSEASLEEQLRASQKLEAVGRLAGGVAHDFNNILGVITGSAELLARELLAAGGDTRRVEDIRRAADRATALTRQLLAFSRRQVMQVQPLDLGNLVASLSGVLRGVMGENIEVLISDDGERWTAAADPGLMEQVLINLAVNAQDAMPDGGRLLIAVRNVTVPPALAEAHPGARPGPHVLLSVEDTGHGMEAAIRERVFEPFFTTKVPGHGTGLGLSTVHGIVQQSGGFVTVSSTPGVGSSFGVYLPRVSEAPTAPADLPPPAPVPPLRHATILLVEDEGQLRSIVREVLEDMGHAVLEAASAEEAWEIAANHTERFDLLLTDVIMTGQTGKDLADGLRKDRPHLKVLFMSGYTDAVLGRHGVLEPGTRFLAKPFSTDVLARAVQEALTD